MQFLNDFHVELSKGLESGGRRLIWRLERSVFEELRSMAEKKGKSLDPDSLILFFPFEIGPTTTGTVELIQS